MIIARQGRTAQLSNMSAAQLHDDHDAASTSPNQVVSHQVAPHQGAVHQAPPRRVVMHTRRHPTAARIAMIRAQIAEGSYITPKKIEQVVERLFTEL